MTIIAALLVCLAVKVIYAVELDCRYAVSCPCGNSEENITVCVPDASVFAEVCTRLSKCANCEEGSNVCLKCLEGLEGTVCPHEGKSRQKRQISYTRRYPKPRTGSRRNCPNLDSPKLGSIRCIYGSDQQTCRGRCLPGYHFTSGDEDEMTLTCQRGAWTPRTSFPACRSAGHCDLIVTGAGAFNCTTGMDGTLCDVICSGRYVGRFFCYPGHEWVPPLPQCVTPKHDDTEGRAACYCKNGGTCDSSGNCVCSSDWMGNECEIAIPKKRSCQDPGFIPNGFRRNPDGSEAMNRRTFEEGQSVVYYCNSDEYALQGSSILVCKSDGSWSRPLPNCINTATVVPQLACLDPGHRSNSYRLNPDGSRVVGVRPHGRPAFAVGHSLAYTCHTGFALQGQSLITCLASGKWSSRTPYCTRITPPTESIPKPSPQQKFCNDPRVDINGIREPKTPPDRRGFPPGSQLAYSCEPGYDLIGASTIFCLIQGSWSSDRPRCASEASTPVTNPITYCQYPGPVANGRVIHIPMLNERRRPSEENEEYPEGSRLQYSCVDGYILEGSNSLTCTNTGEWSDAPPKCVPAPSPLTLTYCQYPGDISQGRVVHSPTLNERKRPSDERQEKYPEGSRLQYSCNDGYTLVGSDTLTCEKTGRWSSELPACERDELYCQPLRRFANGQVIYHPAGQPATTTKLSDDEPYPVGSRLDYSCNEGYILVGSPTISCGKSGFWSAQPPVCGRKRKPTCKHPGIVVNAQVVHVPPPSSRQIPTDQTWELYPVGSQFKYTCDQGYKLEGRDVLYCQNNGTWTLKPPACISESPADIMYCEDPGAVSNGRTQYTPPAMIQRGGAEPSRDYDLYQYPEQASLKYTCNDGYILQGLPSITCESTGFWSGDVPSCVLDCGRSFIKTHNRVLNGFQTISGDWPWVVSLSVQDSDGKTSFICGGAILNAHTVITAAHCLTGPFVDGKTIILRFGKHHFKPEDDDEEVLTAKSIRTIVHPEYNKTALYDSDIGLVIFQPRIRYSILVQPLCLPTRESTFRNIEPGQVGFVSGWGLTEDAVNPNAMLLAELPVVDDAKCMEAYREQNLIITSNMFCAGYDDARQSVCSGDSGSPLVFYDRSKQRHTLEGLVSFGLREQCGKAGKYAIFTKVFRFLPWILRNSQ